jgi:hypothetical protein
VGTVGTIVLAMVGALIGSIAGLAWCKPETRELARRNVALLAKVLVGGMVGLAICMVGLSSELRYQNERIVFVDGQARTEPPSDPNGYLLVSLFGYQVYEDSGPRGGNDRLAPSLGLVHSPRLYRGGSIPGAAGGLDASAAN